MVMRWKILEIAEQCTSLDALFKELENHPEYELPQEKWLQLLMEYIDILPEELRIELQKRASDE